MVVKKPKREAYKKHSIAFSKALYESLDSMAKRDLRSLSGEVIYLLEKAVKEDASNEQ